VFYIQTEVKDGNAYANDPHWGVGQFLCLREPLTPPYAPDRIVPLIQQAAAENAAVIILDGVSEAWAGQGGTLETHRALGGSFSDWEKVNPSWYGLITLLTRLAPCHTITTMKAKSHHVQEQDDNGRWTVRELGLGPVVRPQTEYNFNLLFSMDRATHLGTVVAKTGSMLPESSKTIELTQSLGEELLTWANGGTELEIRVYGNGTFVDWTVDEEARSFDLFKKDNGTPPHTRVSLRNWYKKNKERLVGIEEEE